MNMSKIENIDNYIELKLKLLFENNKEFTEEFMLIMEFYSSKFYDFIPEETLRNEFDEALFLTAKSQYFLGYKIILEILNDEDSNIDNEFLTQPTGYLKNEIPNIFRLIYENPLDEIKTENAKKLVMWLITRFEDTFDLINQTIFELTCLGAHLALKEEIEKRKLTVSNNDNSLLLGNANDLNYINPQLYMIATIKSNEIEKWDIYWSSSIANDKAGEITVLDNNNTIHLNILLHEQIRKVEQDNIINFVGSLLNENKDKETNLNISVFIISEMFTNMY